MHQSDALLDGMDEWNTTHHNNSGLVVEEGKSISEMQAQAQTIDFLKEVEAGM